MADHFKKLENIHEATPKSIMKSKWQSDNLYGKQAKMGIGKHGHQVGNVHSGKIGDKKLPDPTKASHATPL